MVIHAAIQVSKGGQSGQGSHGKGQTSQDFHQWSLDQGDYFGI